MPVTSAGLLLYRPGLNGLEVLLVHPGGPFWARKDLGAWSIPKGEHAPDEDPLAAARREFAEETGSEPPEGPALPLGDAKQPSRKVVTVFAVAGDLDPATIRSATFELEWPPRSGRFRTVPEVDKAGWFTLEEAGRRILPGQAVFLGRLALALSAG